MTFVEIEGNRYPATISGKLNDKDWNGRSSKSICLEMDYTTAKELFVDNINWAIIQPQGLDEEAQEEIFNNSEYSLAGPITDNRDGTITVKMGKMTAEEILVEFQNLMLMPDVEV